MEKFGECANAAIDAINKKNGQEHQTKRAEINKEQTLELAKVDKEGKEVGFFCYNTNND